MRIAVLVALAMFTNRSSKEINLRLVYAGAPSPGKQQNLQYLYDRTDADAKGKMISVDAPGKRTIFFDTRPKGLGEIRGFGVRFHLYTNTSDPMAPGAAKLILKGVDGVVFVVDMRAGRLEANRAALDETKAAMAAHGREWAKVPKVFQLNGKGLAPDEVKRVLGIEREVVVAADSATGEGVFDTMKAVAKETLLGLKDGRVTESVSTPEEQRDGDRMMSRVQVLSHLQEFFGETPREYGPSTPKGDEPPFYVSVHPATKERPYVVYATFGLSTAPQRAGGPEPRLELLAYSAKESDDVLDRLGAIAEMISTAGPNDVPFKTYDTIDVGDRHYALVPPDEPPAFSSFPNEKRNTRDFLFTHHVHAADEAAARVTFAKVLPLTADEAKVAKTKGTRELLKKLAGRPKHAGW